MLHIPLLWLSLWHSTESGFYFENYRLRRMTDTMIELHQVVELDRLATENVESTVDHGYVSRLSELAMTILAFRRSDRPCL